jgi:KaiC/GvpD/RAD55 family RecA-like ATPase
MLTKETILSKVSSYDILNRYLQPYHREGKLMQGKNISNPFLSEMQSTPSFNIFCAFPQHEWRYKDFATGDEGSCFDLVMKLYNLDYNEALYRIDDDFKLGLNGINCTSYFKAPAAIPVSVTAKPFKITKRNFTQAELDFWSKYGITITTLCDYKVFALSELTTINKEGKVYTIQSSPDKFIFCYDHGNWLKLYKPLDEKKYRFQYLGTKKPGYLFGFDQLPKQGTTVFLTGGEKDVLSLSAHGFPAFTLNSETADLNQQLVADLKHRFSHVLILYDNDDTGKAQSASLCREHGLKRIVLPEMPSGKDISDFFASGKTSIDFSKFVEDALQSAPPQKEEKFVYDGIEIIEFGHLSPQYLMSPIFPRKGTAVLAGKPDTGKSQIARQLCIYVALGLKQFIGFDLNIVHQRSVYVATEDGMEACSYLYQQQLKGLGQEPTKNIQFIIADTFEQDEVLRHIDETLTKAPADLVVVDSFGDIFKGFDSNSNMAMRNTVKVFDRVAKKHNCLILFVHHINKGAYRQAPGQEHIQGGAGLVQKVRLAIQLTEGEGFLKYFTVVKGNYCPKEYKANAIELEFSEKNFLFTPTGNFVPIEQLGEQPNKDEKDLKYKELEALAEGIFGNKILSHGDFIRAYSKATGKSTSSAKRCLKDLLKYNLVVECQRGYRITNHNSASDDENGDEEF